MKTSPEKTPPLVVETGAWRRTMTCAGVPVLSLFLSWPKLSWDTAAGRRIQRYYNAVVAQWRAQWEGALYHRACAALDEAQANSRPFSPWETTLRFTITLVDDQMLSLYTEAYQQTGGRHPLTVRRGDCWHLAGGTPCPLGALFPPKAHWKQQLLTAAAAQIAQRHAAGEARFDDDYPAKLAECFDAQRFYLTADTLFFFYPLLSIAPFVEGIPTFSIPRPLLR